MKAFTTISARIVATTILDFIDIIRHITTIQIYKSAINGIISIIQDYLIVLYKFAAEDVLSDRQVYFFDNINLYIVFFINL